MIWFLSGVQCSNPLVSLFIVVLLVVVVPPCLTSSSSSSPSSSSSAPSSSVKSNRNDAIPANFSNWIDEQTKRNQVVSPRTDEKDDSVTFKFRNIETLDFYNFASKESKGVSRRLRISNKTLIDKKSNSEKRLRVLSKSSLSSLCDLLWKRDQSEEKIDGRPFLSECNESDEFPRVEWIRKSSIQTTASLLKGKINRKHIDWSFLNENWSYGNKTDGRVKKSESPYGN